MNMNINTWIKIEQIMNWNIYIENIDISVEFDYTVHTVCDSSNLAKLVEQAALKNHPLLQFSKNYFIYKKATINERIEFS